MIKFDFCSDLHVDIWHHTTRLVNPPGEGPQSRDKDGNFQYIDWEWYKNADSNVLIIAGDTANSVGKAADVFISASKVYEWVVVIDGNHEHYEGSSISLNTLNLEMSLKPYKNIIFLTGNSFQIGDTLFTGALGWYDWRGWETHGITKEQAYATWVNRSNDSREISYGEYVGPAQLAATHAVNIAEEVRKAQSDDSIQNIVVVTHTSPDARLMYWHPTDDGWNKLTPSYMNSSMSMVRDADVNEKIRYWIYGHTHERKMVQIGHIIYANNAMGYPRENGPWFLPQLDL